MRLSKGLLFGIALTVLTGQATAQVIAEYNFDGASPVASNTAPGITAGDANFTEWDPAASAPGFSGSSAFARSSATNNVAIPLEQNLSEALAADNYLSFKIDGTGYSVDSIGYVHSVTGAPSNGIYASYLFTSKTGFSEGDQLTDAGVGLPTTTLTTATSTTDTVSFDTSGITELQGLSEEIEIRIYLSDNFLEGSHVHFLDSIIVSGVPEPGSLALLGLGGLCLSWRRRG